MNFANDEVNITEKHSGIIIATLAVGFAILGIAIWHWYHFLEYLTFPLHGWQ